MVDIAWRRLYPVQRRFVIALQATQHQIIPQLVRQEPLHRFRSVPVLHHHKRAVLRQGFNQGSRSFSVRRYVLMGPPLMRHFMRRQVEGQINRIGLFVYTRNETNALRKWNSVGERLRKTGIAWEFDNAQLMEMERAEIGAAVSERRLHAVGHAVQVEFVAGLVVDLQVYVVPAVAPHLVPPGIEGEEVQNRGVHLVMEVPAPVLYPFFLQISWCNGDLVGAGADSGFEIDPVAV